MFIRIFIRYGGEDRVVGDIALLQSITHCNDGTTSKMPFKWAISKSS
jgi:hypothetical protein